MSVAVFLVLVISTLAFLWRTHGPALVQRRLALVLAVALAQAAIGYIQYFNDIPAVLVGFHIAGATAVFAATLHFVLGMSTRVPLRRRSASSTAATRPAVVGS